MEGEFELATLDMVIVGLYVVMILAIGFFAGRGRKDPESYFLGGREHIWPLVGFGLLAVNFSGTQYIGLAGAGYEEGIAVWNYEWMAMLVLAFFALFVLPFYLRARISTVPEFLERRYDRKARYAFSGFTVFTAMFIDSAGAMFAGAISLQLLFPEIPIGVLVTAIALLGGAYVVLGGLHAVTITDLIQGIMMLLAGVFIFFRLFAELDFSWAAIQDLAPDGGWTITPPADDDFLPWPGIFTGVLWLGLYYWITNHVVVQKVLAAKDVNHGRWGALFAGFVQVFFLFLLILPGTMGREIFPDIEEPDQIWQALIFEIFPVGIRGLVFAALVAALMSTLDSVLNGAASLVTNDFIKNSRWDPTDRQLLAIGRVLVGVFMIFAALWAPVLTQFPTLVEYFQSFLGYITMPVVVVILGGLFWARATAPAAFWTLVIVAPIGFAGFLTGEVWQLHETQFLYGTGIMLALSLIVFLLLTFLTRAPKREEVEQYLWTKDHWREETEELRGLPWWKNYRYLTAGAVAVTVAMIIPFIGGGGG